MHDVLALISVHDVLALISQFLPRKRFFNDLRALTCYLCLDSWDALMGFMVEKLELDVPDTS